MPVVDLIDEPDQIEADLDKQAQLKADLDNELN